jgi:hypothetical protein
MSQFDANHNSPQLFLAQVGNAKAPSTNQRLQLSYEAKRIVTDLHNGGRYDHHNCRSPLSIGNGSITGVYPMCANQGGCEYARLEIDNIYCSTGKRTPFLFFRDDPDRCKSTQECFGCRQDDKCGQWMWAWGKIIKADNPSNIDDYKTPKGIETTFDFQIDGPLMEVNASDWRYGIQDHVPNDMLDVEYEASASNIYFNKPFWMPCNWNGCCENYRFFFRQLETTTDLGTFLFPQTSKMFYGNWYANVYYLSNMTQKIVVDGNYDPRTRLSVRGIGTTITIKNSCGEMSYTVTNNTNEPTLYNLTAYFDSETGELLMEGLVTYGLPNSRRRVIPFLDCEMPQLLCGENIVTVTPGNDPLLDTGGDAWIGVNRRWIN